MSVFQLQQLCIWNFLSAMFVFFFWTGRVKHVLIDRVQYARWFAIILYANVVMVRLESKMGAGLRGHCGHSVLHTRHCHSTLAFVKS